MLLVGGSLCVPWRSRAPRNRFRRLLLGGEFSGTASPRCIDRRSGTTSFMACRATHHPLDPKVKALSEAGDLLLANRYLVD